MRIISWLWGRISIGNSSLVSSSSSPHFVTIWGDNEDVNQVSNTSSSAINDNLFDKGQIITKETGWDMCIESGAGGFVIKATNGTDQLTLDQNGTWGESYWIIVW